MRRFACWFLLCSGLGTAGTVPPARALDQAEVSRFMQDVRTALKGSCGQVRESSGQERPALLLAARGSSPLPALHRLGATPPSLMWMQMQAPLNAPATAARLVQSCSSGQWVLGGAVDGATLGLVLWLDDRRAWMMDATRREAGVRIALEAINLARVKGGRCGDQVFAPVPALSPDARLRQSSLDYAAAQLLRPTGHRGADGSTPVSRAGVPGAQEVLAYGLSDPLQVVQAWLDSPSHCRSLRDPALKRIGLDYQLGGSTGAVWGALLTP